MVSGRCSNRVMAAPTHLLYVDQAGASSKQSPKVRRCPCRMAVQHLPMGYWPMCACRSTTDGRLPLMTKASGTKHISRTVDPEPRARRLFNFLKPKATLPRLRSSVPTIRHGAGKIRQMPPLDEPFAAPQIRL